MNLSTILFFSVPVVLLLIFLFLKKKISSDSFKKNVFFYFIFIPILGGIIYIMFYTKSSKLGEGINIYIALLYLFGWGAFFAKDNDKEIAQDFIKAAFLLIIPFALINVQDENSPERTLNNYESYQDISKFVVFLIIVFGGFHKAAEKLIGKDKTVFDRMRTCIDEIEKNKKEKGKYSSIYIDALLDDTNKLKEEDIKNSKFNANELEGK